MENLITANIRSRPTRTFISILAVALGVILMLVVGGIVSGTLDDSVGRTVAVGADFILQPSGSSILYAFSDATLNERIGDVVREVPGVSVVTPVLSRFIASQFGLVFGIDLETYNQFPGRLEIISGTPSLQGFEVIIDQAYANARDLVPGMTLNILDHDFTVTAICRPGAVVRIFVPLETLKQITGSIDKVTLMFIRADPNADLDVVYQALSDKFQGYSLLRSSDPSLLLAETNLPGLNEFRFLIIMISLMLSFMVILLAMYTTIFERTREIGILKSLGASRRFIVGMIIKESAMICGSGAVFGIIISLIIKVVIIASFPTLQVSMGIEELMQGLLLGLLAGTLGALYPAYKAAKMDPVQALSYE
jgi:putative ABC transport system permease protein